MRKYTATSFALLALGTSNAMAQSDICAALDGSVVVNSDNEFIGKIANSYDQNSIFNQYGRYGSQYQTGSVWNEYGKNGSEYQADSAFNKFSSNPPRIIKNGKILARLTANKFIPGAINPIVLGAVCYDFEPPR